MPWLAKNWFSFFKNTTRIPSSPNTQGRLPGQPPSSPLHPWFYGCGSCPDACALSPAPGEASGAPAMMCTVWPAHKDRMCQGQAVWRQTLSVDGPISEWQQAQLVAQELSQLSGHRRKSGGGTCLWGRVQPVGWSGGSGSWSRDFSCKPCSVPGTA